MTNFTGILFIVKTKSKKTNDKQINGKYPMSKAHIIQIQLQSDC